MTTRTQATVEDLYRVPDNGKAEIVNGEIVLMSPTGDMPGRAGGAIYASLRGIERQAGGRAYPDNVGFKVNLPHRKSFSPDAAFYVGKPSGMKFLEGAPVFAAEIRSENDCGREAELEIEAKRKDYFAAGTKVVWELIYWARMSSKSIEPPTRIIQRFTGAAKLPKPSPVSPAGECLLMNCLIDLAPVRATPRRTS